MDTHMMRKTLRFQSSNIGTTHVDAAYVQDEDHFGLLVDDLMQLIHTAGSYLSFVRIMQKKESSNLVRRLKLLLPLLEEIHDSDELSSTARAFVTAPLLNLKRSIVSANNVLITCKDASKIYLASESEAITCRFHSVYDKLHEALEHFPYDKIGISLEVKEQVELMRMQLKRAKRRADTQDIELAMDLMVAFSMTDDRSADIAVLERLAKKLELVTIPDLRAESLAVKKLCRARSGLNTESIQQIVFLLGKFKEITGVNNETNAAAVVDAPISSKRLEKFPSLLIPNEFLCPITLEIMTDPVIVATGQTYERESIQKWLNSNHRTCPKTGQVLVHMSLAPNYALRNLILHWCDKNNVDLPKTNPCDRTDDNATLEREEEISTLVQYLSSNQLLVQTKAITKIRGLAKENPTNRTLIAERGGIRPLVKLLSHADTKIQEQTVTAILNLSLDESNKRCIASEEGAIPAIISVLRTGTNEARENSAAALFSLSMLDENKEKIGCLKGIAPLVSLLKDGTVRGKKDAATALFNLCLSNGNKSRAIRAGIIPQLLCLIEDKDLRMIDEALSILLLLARHPEGLNEIGGLSFIETLVGITREGTPKNKECATSVLLELGLNNSSFVLAALQYGVYEHLVEITRCGTNRAQRKANSLLQHMSKCEHIP